MLGAYELDSIHVGEASEMLGGLPDNSIDLTITSPVYDEMRAYNGYVFPFTGIANQLIRITKKGGVLVWIVGDQTVKGSESGSSFRQALYFLDHGLNLYDTMIFEQLGTGAKGSKKAYWQSFEYMFVFSKGMPKTINRIKDRLNIHAGKTSGTNKTTNTASRYRKKNLPVAEYGYRTNIWKYHVGNNGDDEIGKKHPARFPEALARDHIISWSKPGDVVLDPMCGGGTVGKIAIENRRHYLMFDISAEYVELSNKRVLLANNPLPFFEEVTT